MLAKYRVEQPSEFSNFENLSKATAKVYEEFESRHPASELIPVAGTADGTPVLYRKAESAHNRKLRYLLMKAVLENPLAGASLSKASANLASNVFGYDLRAPSLHMIPWLSPIRDVTPRSQRPQPADAAHWKSIRPATFSAGGFQADPWINEGARAPQITFSAETKTAPYITIGQDGSDTYEAQSAGQGFEDVLSTARFFALESLYTREEDALLGGNRTLLIGTANTPTNTTAVDASATLNSTYFVAVVGLTYAGIRNQSVSAGLIQQKVIVTPDNKTMTVNGGMGIRSAASTGQAVTTGNSLVSTVVQKAGELGWAWYVGTSNVASNMFLQQITTVPTMTLTAQVTSTQALSALTSTDFSINNGTQGGGSGLVTAFDGFLTQVISASQEATPNAYYRQLAGAKLTSSGRGSVVEIDAVFKYLWDIFRTSIDRIYVNSQQLLDITTACLSNASGPLLRYDVSGDGEKYDLVASGTIAFYFNPFVDGGKKIPIVVHPTLPAGTIFLQGLALPPYFKKSNLQNTAEVLCRRDYYGVDWAPRTREYEFGTYSEEVLAVYAPFSYGVLTGIGSGVAGI